MPDCKNSPDGYQVEPHATRWAGRRLKRMFAWDWTKWHATEDASMTLCGLPIRLAIEGGTFLPETDDGFEKVDCKKCLKVIAARRKDGE
jgi:hypothetical protein